ncbi:MAB_1171c family putative transporter [Streptomyces sp. NPDC047315]|uniref:MAB_1171c family putative transporter n=1 Tax=Streptomyces sp. NPDC047315 TaxID=3155142 RepID=UPI0033FA9748
MKGELVGSWHLALNHAALCLLWVSVLLRAGPAVRHHEQRGLWIATASAAAAMTLHTRLVSTWATELTGSATVVVLAKNQIGVVSAGAVLYFVVHATGGRRRTGTAVTAMAAVMVALLALAFAGAEPAKGQFVSIANDCAACAAYTLLLCATHIVACTTCVYICWTYGSRSPTRSLSLGLALFGWGTALAGFYWLDRLTLLVSGLQSPATVLSLALSLHAILRAAALLVPLAAELRSSVRHARTIWRIWPLWRDLVDAVPHVVLSSSRRRLMTLVLPRIPWRLAAYRKVIETQDAMLVLRQYADSAVSDCARAHVARWTVPSADAEAFVSACVLRMARAAKLSGGPPRTTPGPALASRGRGGLEAETDFLIRLADASSTDCVRAFPLAPWPPTTHCGESCPKPHTGQ